MEHLQHVVLDEQLEQRGKIEIGRLGIDGGGFGGRGDLNQAQIRVIGAFAHEFGVDRHKIRLGEARAQRGEGFGVGDQRMYEHDAA